MKINKFKLFALFTFMFSLAFTAFANTSFAHNHGGKKECKGESCEHRKDADYKHKKDEKHEKHKKKMKEHHNDDDHDDDHHEEDEDDK